MTVKNDFILFCFFGLTFVGVRERGIELREAQEEVAEGEDNARGDIVVADEQSQKDPAKGVGRSDHAEHEVGVARVPEAGRDDVTVHVHPGDGQGGKEEEVVDAKQDVVGDLEDLQGGHHGFEETRLVLIVIMLLLRLLKSRLFFC